MNELINEFQKMPSIGPKSAQRLAFYILALADGEVTALTSAITNAKAKIKHCSICHNITVQDPCVICNDQARDHQQICVVSEPRDIIAIEKTREFKGVYHVLGGLISPLEGITPETLRIKELLKRIEKEQMKELILAINPTVEGEATAIYLSKLIKPLGVKMTRIAYGLPVGSNIDYADEVTLTKSYEGRVEL
ncbi:recombination mediator RecR [Candidatus Margulisiibacteriota bacterium]